jgi:L-rhamnose mutarotase
MSPVRRIAQIVHLKPSAVAAYKECHANVWPEVLQQIKDCNIVDCKYRLMWGLVRFFN